MSVTVEMGGLVSANNDLTDVPVLTFDKGICTLDSYIERLRRCLHLSRNHDGCELPDGHDSLNLYTIVYEMCVQARPHNYAAELYMKFRRYLLDFLRDDVLPALHRPYAEVATLLRAASANYHVFSKALQCYFQYLDKHYVVRHQKAPLRSVVSKCFRSVILEALPDRLTEEVLNLILCAREGQPIDAEILREVTNILVLSEEDGTGAQDHLRIYRERLEHAILKNTFEYYTRKCHQLFRIVSCREYIARVDDCARVEEQQVLPNLHESSRSPIRNTIYKLLLDDVHEDLFRKKEKGPKHMMEQLASEDLRRLYVLYLPLPHCLEKLANILEDHVSEKCTLIHAEAAQKGDGTAYVSDLIALQTRFNGLIDVSFDGSLSFHKALNKALETVLSHPISGLNASELLAQYLHEMLREGGSIPFVEAELDSILSGIVDLLCCVRGDKDIFVEFHRQLLSRRLLGRRSRDIDLEKRLIFKLKQRFGNGFTSKLERMIRDMDQSLEHQAMIRRCEELDKNPFFGIELSVDVLSSGCWPTFKQLELVLPANLKQCLSTFEKLYQLQTVGRRLRWIHSLGSVTISGVFGRRRHDIVVSNMQAVMLLLFNHQKEWRISDLISMIQANASELKKQLRPLVVGKACILSKTPVQGYDNSHVLRVNDSFVSSSRIVRVPKVVPSSEKLSRQTTETVRQDRIHALEACIVRVMKARRSLEQSVLVGEVLEQVASKFHAEPRVLHRCIEDLITRDYLARSQSTIQYLA